jgi:Tetratricopeptide repeat
MTPQATEGVVDLLNTGRLAQALAVAEGTLKATPEDLEARLVYGIALRTNKRFEDAIATFDQTARRADIHGDSNLAANARFQLGLVYSDQQDWPAAYAVFESVVEPTTVHADWSAAMCHTLCRLERSDEALVWGRRTIEIRNREAICDGSEVVPRVRPKTFDPNATKRNIVSYSLFGLDRYYHECAITIARTTPVMFPEFTARFYCAPDVPEQVLKTLLAAKAQVKLAAKAEGSSTSPFAGLFWRFLPFDDPDVDVVMVRDVDSPILSRERAGIDLWLASDAPFYCLRDHPIHAEPLLAGMWGGFTGVLPKIAPLAIRHARSDYSKFADQRFLRRVIWPRIRATVLSIDSCNLLGPSVDFPEGFPKFGRLHVGVSWTRDQILSQ